MNSTQAPALWVLKGLAIAIFITSPRIINNSSITIYKILWCCRPDTHEIRYDIMMPTHITTNHHNHRDSCSEGICSADAWAREKSVQAACAQPQSTGFISLISGTRWQCVKHGVWTFTNSPIKTSRQIWWSSGLSNCIYWIYSFKKVTTG